MGYRLIYLYNQNMWNPYLLNDHGYAQSANTYLLEYDLQPMMTGVYDFLYEYYLHRDERGNVTSKEVTRILYFVSPLSASSCDVLEFGTLFINQEYFDYPHLPAVAMDSLPSSAGWCRLAMQVAFNHIDYLFQQYGEHAQVLDSALNAAGFVAADDSGSELDLKESDREQIQKLAKELEAVKSELSQLKSMQAIVVPAKPPEKLPEKILDVPTDLVQVSALSAVTIIDSVLQSSNGVKDKIVEDDDGWTVVRRHKKYNPNAPIVFAAVNVVIQPPPTVFRENERKMALVTTKPKRSRQPKAKPQPKSVVNAPAAIVYDKPRFNVDITKFFKINPQYTEKLFHFSVVLSLNWLTLAAAEHCSMVNRKELFSDQRAWVDPNVIAIGVAATGLTWCYLSRCAKAEEHRVTAIVPTRLNKFLEARKLKA